MNKVERRKLYVKAIQEWGMTSQLGMLMEECAELIHATHKFIRKQDSSIRVRRNFVEEIADVEIMLEQIKFTLYDGDLQDTIKTAKYDKLLRLRDMLEEIEKIQY